MLKLKKLEDENILIPKKGKEEAKQEETGVDDVNKQVQEEMTKTLQEEIRQLHFKLRQKEQII